MKRLLRNSVIVLCACVSLAGAQSDAYWEVRPMAGVAVPTGAHRRAFADVAFVGAQTSIRLSSAFDLVASFGWQSSTGKYAVSDNHANVLVYNFGVEKLFRSGGRSDGAFVPFGGAGVGGRAYDFRSSALESTACYAGYANGGVMYERRRTAVRLELRDNLFCFKGPVAPFEREARNEMSVGVGWGVRF